MARQYGARDWDTAAVGARTPAGGVLPLLAPYQAPGIDEDSPGGTSFEVLDPFGHTLRFTGAAR
ncbi:MAG: hypothetical protein JWP66_1952 [Naasia sp.]|nr:hypothetical protein [Naasia sp.]